MVCFIGSSADMIVMYVLDCFVDFVSCWLLLVIVLLLFVLDEWMQG